MFFFFFLLLLPHIIKRNVNFGTFWSGDLVLYRTHYLFLCSDLSSAQKVHKLVCSHTLPCTYKKNSLHSTSAQPRFSWQHAGATTTWASRVVPMNPVWLHSLGGVLSTTPTLMNINGGKKGTITESGKTSFWKSQLARSSMQYSEG